jgi:hypothetical protein
MTEAKTKRPAKTKQTNKVVKAVTEANETGARRAILEDLFYDFHRSRSQVYLMNFVRGLCFGFGSVLGATLLIALTVWVLGLFGNVFPPLADFLNNLIDTMQKRR